MAKTRIYLVQPNVVIDGKPAPAKLIEAVTPSQAIRHASKNSFTIAVATPKQVAQLVKAGTELETASDEEIPNEPLLPLDKPADTPADPPPPAPPADDFGKGDAPQYPTIEEENAAAAQHRRAHRKGGK